MKKFVLLLAALICTQVAAIAAPDNVTTGPYKISFDLGIPKDAYTTKIAEIKESESLSGKKSIEYGFTITNLTGMGRILSLSLHNYEKEQTKMFGSDLELVIKAVLRSYDVQGIETATREIDGTNGAIASGKAYFSGIPIKMFMAGYQPQNGTEVHDMVFILSSFPWDKGTLSLLKTIHVDKVKS
jgi:hypothetical protein